MQPHSDPLIGGSSKAAGIGGGYQTIEGGSGGVYRSSSVATSFYSVRALYTQAKEAKQSSQGCCDFCLAFFGILIGSLVWTIMLIITIMLPIIMIILGVTYLHDCHDQKMIPIFNIVAGCVLTVSNFMNLIARSRSYSVDDVPKAVVVVGWITTVLNIFLVGWFIAGCFWVYGIKYPKTDDQCDRNLYSFTYWLMNAVFIFFGSLAVAAVIMSCLILMCF